MSTEIPEESIYSTLLKFKWTSWPASIKGNIVCLARQTILPLIEAGHEVHLNLSKVEYMDSSGISVLIESKKLSEQKNTKFELVEVSKPVEKVLAMSRKFLWVTK